MRAIAIACLAVLLAGCGSDKDEHLPAACAAGPEAFVKALGNAPGAVTLDGTPISRCFNRGANADDVQVLGALMLAATQQLSDDVREGKPGAALELGYLIGAAQRGAKRNGLADELVRRLQAEATVDASQRADYNRGLHAGAAGG